MKKVKEYKNMRFNADVFREAIYSVKELAKESNTELKFSNLTVEHDDSSWHYDKIEEFLADYRKYSGYSYFSIYGGDFDLSVECLSRSARISIKASTRADIEYLFEVFEKYSSQSMLPAIPVAQSPAPVVFIGHGRSSDWRDLKDHLQDKHGFCIEAYESGARAGHTIRDILEEMIKKSSFAILVMTCEDEQDNGRLRARQNVIHEAGLFQGSLGFARAILLLEENVEEFSNVQGIQYIPFSKDNIKETFGEVLATLRREFQ